MLLSGIRKGDALNFDTEDNGDISQERIPTHLVSLPLSGISATCRVYKLKRTQQSSGQGLACLSLILISSLTNEIQAEA